MPRTRELVVHQRYIHLPVQNGAPKRTMRLFLGDTLVREFEIELALEQPDFWVFCDLAPFQGQRLSMALLGEDIPSSALDAVRSADALPDAAMLYRERCRPQFHFSSQRGWNNDPNGLLYYDGEYHLFYQHNPYGWKWGNMHWGHAISPDLVHWRELGDALYPDALGTMFSGSGVVDWENTTCFQEGEEKALVCIYTAAGGTSPASQGQPFTQSIAYSRDRGRTWHKYQGNPVLSHIIGHNRDPKVFWHQPTSRWIMALYLEGNDYALFASPDLVDWQRLQDITLPGCSECPDLFPLPVDGDPDRVLWVFWGANGTYLLGTFDGHAFTPQGAPLRFGGCGHSYAAQTWSDIPAADGRRIQIAWLRVDLPGMPFNQCMTFPCTLTLRTTPEGVRLHGQPVRELALLHDQAHAWEDLTLRPGDDPLAAIAGELFDIRAEFSLGQAEAVALLVRGVTVTYDARAQELTCLDARVPLQPVGGRIRLQLLADRTSLEIYGQDGQTYVPLGVLLADQERRVRVSAQGGAVYFHHLEVVTLRSAWGAGA